MASNYPPYYLPDGEAAYPPNFSYPPNNNNHTSYGEEGAYDAYPPNFYSFPPNNSMPSYHGSYSAPNNFSGYIVEEDEEDSYTAPNTSAYSVALAPSYYRSIPVDAEAEAGGEEDPRRSKKKGKKEKKEKTHKKEPKKGGPSYRDAPNQTLDPQFDKTTGNAKKKGKKGRWFN